MKNITIYQLYLFQDVELDNQYHTKVHEHSFQLNFHRNLSKELNINYQRLSKKTKKYIYIFTWS